MYIGNDNGNVATENSSRFHLKNPFRDNLIIKNKKWRWIIDEKGNHFCVSRVPSSAFMLSVVITIQRRDARKPLNNNKITQSDN